MLGYKDSVWSPSNYPDELVQPLSPSESRSVHLEFMQSCSYRSRGSGDHVPCLCVSRARSAGNEALWHLCISILWPWKKSRRLSSNGPTRLKTWPCYRTCLKWVLSQKVPCLACHIDAMNLVKCQSRVRIVATTCHTLTFLPMSSTTWSLFSLIFII